MTTNIDLTKGFTKEQSVQIVDELIYRNYRYNRNINPHIPVEKYKILFGIAVDLMEVKYQKRNGEDKEMTTNHRWLWYNDAVCPVCYSKFQYCTDLTQPPTCGKKECLIKYYKLEKYFEQTKTLCNQPY